MTVPAKPASAATGTAAAASRQVSLPAAGAAGAGTGANVPFQPATQPAAHAQPARRLGQYLRGRREQLQPQDCGIGPTRRRRVPGLRREELAQLCGVSPTWITWLEQGRGIRPSAQLLDRLAEALHLQPAERHYLFDLAGHADPRPPQRPAPGAWAVQQLPHHLHTAAYVLDERWNAVAWNRAAEQLFVGWLDRRDDPAPNLLSYVFLCPQARELIEDWPDRARRLVAEFRAESARHADGLRQQELVRHLSADSADFASAWRHQTVAEREGGLRVFRHPRQGRLQFQQTTLFPAMHPGLKLVVLLPVDDAAAKDEAAGGNTGRGRGAG